MMPGTPVAPHRDLLAACSPGRPAPAAAAQPPAAVRDMRQGDPDQLHGGFQLQWQACLGGRERHRRPAARMHARGMASVAAMQRDLSRPCCA